MSAIPKITMSNGIKIPQFGLGTWKSKPGEVEEAVKAAIDCGYRHIDCALVYGNENEVGAAITAKIAQGVVKREDLFITSKVWNTFHSKSKVMKCVKQTLASLQVASVDLLLMHWPMGLDESDDAELFPKTAEGAFSYSDVDYLETWGAMEEVYELGLAKAIGLSNFNSKQIERVLSAAKVKPMMNQVEIHPYFNNEKLVHFCLSKDIKVTGYSPLGSPDRPWAKPDDPVLLQDPAVLAIAAKHGKSSAQVLIRFELQRGIVVIPKSVTPSRIASNMEVFDFELTDEDMETIMGFNRADGRACHVIWWKDHPHWPFSEEF